MRGGYVGKILYVDLSSGDVSKKPLNKEDARLFIGGRGLGAKILYSELKPETDPLGPQNKLIFATGPIGGTLAPVGSRTALVTKSPSTGTILMSTQGGRFGTELKFAGYDALVVYGKASKPSYIWIRDEEVEIRDATWLWGMKTYDVARALREELKDFEVQIECIGPAGEKLVKFASIHSIYVYDNRAFARGGSGAVMGSKNLKAIAVRGTGKIDVADKEKFMEAVSNAVKKFKESPYVYPIFVKYGSVFTFNDQAYNFGILPTRYFQTGVFEGANKIDRESQLKYEVKKMSCALSCLSPCGRIRHVGEGPLAGVSADGPEYETTVTLGSLCGVDYMPALIAAQRLCDEYGMDGISAGNMIAFAMYLFEKGIITMEDVDGIELKFGNYNAELEMLKRIAYREGFGDILAEGVKMAAEKIGRGAEKCAMHVKGLEIPAYDPRGAPGMGLGYATSPRGACHGRASDYSLRPYYKIDRLAIEGKGIMIKQAQDARCIFDCAVMCMFLHGAAFAGSLEETAALLSAATGFNFNVEELLKTGERINNLERCFNVREGFTRADDTLPKRFMEEPLPEGPSKGLVLSAEMLNQMLDEYYQSRGWDKKTGIPTRAKLEELELEFVADELEKLKKLPT